MNTLMKAIVLSISTALVAAPAMAAPQDHNPSHHAEQQKVLVKQHAQHNPTTHKKALKPSHDWKAGQKVPSQYHGKSFKVNHTQYKKLSKPGKNQQWIKVNGDYILINVINHNIIKIIAG